MPPVINRERCVGCGTCVAICPTQVFRHFPKEDIVPVAVFADECWHCNSCVLDCRSGAIELRLPIPLMMLHVESSSLHQHKSTSAKGETTHG